MDLQQAEEMALAIMGEHGLTRNGWTFGWDSAVRRLGLTQHRLLRVSLSRPLTALNPEATVRNTILHEVAHALVGGLHGHDSVWRAKALEIGCDGRRLSRAVMPKAKWEVHCAHCGQSFPSQRRRMLWPSAYHKQCGPASVGKLTIRQLIQKQEVTA